MVSLGKPQIDTLSALFNLSWGVLAYIAIGCTATKPNVRTSFPGWMLCINHHHDTELLLAIIQLSQLLYFSYLTTHSKGKMQINAARGKPVKLLFYQRFYKPDM